MQTGSLAMLALLLCGSVVAALAYAGVNYFRYLVRVRCARLEDALRVYNSANASLGRHVTAMEAELRELRQRLAAIEGAGVRARLRDAPPAAPRVDECMDAERRLSQLIRQRLGELHPG